MAGKRIVKRIKESLSRGSSSPSPQPGTSNLEEVKGDPPTSSGLDTPFKDFVLSRLEGNTQQKLFAMTFAEQIHCDRNALAIDLEDVFVWLGFTRRDQAVRLLKSEINESEYIFIPGNLHKSVDHRDQRDRYLISITMFKKLLFASRSQEGKDYRNLIIIIEEAAYDYMKIYTLFLVHLYCATTPADRLCGLGIGA